MDKDDNEILKPGKRRSDGVEESLTSAGVAELPLARVKTIMQKGGDDLPISQEGLFAMAKAAVCIEMFISELTKNVYEAADANCVEYCHLADYVQQSDELDFLHEKRVPLLTFSESFCFNARIL
ncbi:unnamed protein product [Enterobius vermicularis]|uniref:CBFD_NFYB_HMF domain-containing protein n=1 Tax=Enterobius vermicularis TaxID=51028 RepID=A0A0N4UVE9_ENTVE|nr:unnamed protein product [Enterobius vermicularis]